MAFIEVTDPDTIVELYKNGLLYEQYTYLGDEDPVELAVDWDIDALRLHPKRNGLGKYKFYICLED